MVLLKHQVPDGFELFLANQLPSQYPNVILVQDGVPVLLEYKIQLGDTSIFFGVFSLVIGEEFFEAGVDVSFLG